MFKKGINSFQLKCIAIITMLIDHTATVVLYAMIKPYIINNTLNLAEAGSRISFLYYLIRVFNSIGRMAFPIFCFLLVEGFLHTKSIKKYIGRLFLFAIISEIPHDLAFFGQVFELSLQNVMFTLLIGMLVLCIIKKVEEKFESDGLKKVLLIFLSILVGTGFCILIRCEYENVAVITIAVLYLFRELKVFQIVGGVFPLFVKANWAGVSIIPMFLYNKERGRKIKYFFYGFYPVHLILLYCIALLL